MDPAPDAAAPTPPAVASLPPGAPSWRERFAHAQHRDSVALLFNTGATAAAGLVFWIVLTRVVGLPAADVGVGYAMVAFASLLAVLAKGGLDTALVRHLPAASRADGARVLGFATAVALATLCLLGAAALLLTGRTADAALWGVGGWLTVAALAALLVITWLQDAAFLAADRAQWSAARNLLASGLRIVLPLALVPAAVAFPVATAWGLAVGAAAVLGLVLLVRLPARDGADVHRPAFLGTAARNLPAGAAEFLPGLLLTPLVLAIEGPAAAAYFGMAWSVASLLFLGAAAIGRSALAEMARPGRALAPAVRRSAAQVVVLLAPAAVAGIALAPIALGIFGADYAREGALPFAILCASLFVVAPGQLQLAVLRVREQTVPLVVAPLVTLTLLLLLAPPFQQRAGLAGVATAWLLANVPFGLWSAWKLHAAAGVRSPAADAAPVHGRAHLE